MNCFFVGLMTMPDKIQEVMDVMMPHLVGHICKRASQEGYPAVWIGGWRSARNMISPAFWERFVWPCFEKAVNEVVNWGLIALLHLDSDWTRDLAFFKSLPKAKCILSTDGQTDLFKAKQVLGGHMCLMGDVPATMLAFDTTDEIYAYSTRLIKELGPDGFILHSGCDIRMDAKLPNIQAMMAAATGR